MKKTLLSLLAVASVYAANGQTQPVVKNHISDVAVYDDFKDGNKDVEGNNEYSAKGKNKGWNTLNATSKCYLGDGNGNEILDTAYKGIYWSESPAGCPLANGFVASKKRQNDKISYTISQSQGAYEPFLVLFGSYSDNGTEKKYSLDLSNNANVSFSLKNAGDKLVRFAVQMQDVNGKSLVYTSTAEQGTFYNSQIGFIQGESSAIEENTTVEFDFDFGTAKQGCQKPTANEVEGGPTCPRTFDLTKVAAIAFTLVQDANTGPTAGEGSVSTCNDFCPLALVDYPIEISNFKIGDQTKLTVGLLNNVSKSTFSVFPNPSNGVANFSTEVTNVTVMDATGNIVETIEKTSSINTSSYNKGIYMIKADQGTSKVVVE